MKRAGKLHVGLRGAYVSALGLFAAGALGVALLRGTAVAVLLAGAAVVTCVGLALAWMQSVRLDGSLLCLRSLATVFGARAVHARTLGSLKFRRSPGPRRLRVRAQGHGAAPALVLYARDADNAAFRAITLWLIVHGRRGAHIDGVLLDALASVHGPEGAGLPHDTSHA